MASDENNRLSSVSFLGKDDFLLFSLSGREALSELFEYEALLLTDKDSVTADDALGKEISIEIKSRREEGAVRHIHGIVVHFGRAATHDISGAVTYQVIIVPEFWLATLNRDSRIFQKKTTTQIIETILKDDLGISKFKNSAPDSGTTEREYCVQYNESSFNFLSRLMEEEGIYYYFEHAKDGHTIVFADGPDAHSVVTNSETIPMRATGDGIQTIFSWLGKNSILPTGYTAGDYDPEAPATVLRSFAEITREYNTEKKFQHYVYPAGFKTAADGDSIALRRAEALQSLQKTYEGVSDAIGLGAGAKFKLEKNEDATLNQDYLVLETTLKFSEPSLVRGTRNAMFAIALSAIPFSEKYRPQKKTPRPNMTGIHNAIVVAADKEEILVDKNGGIKIQFFWDRDGKRNEDSSAFVRTAQMWAGNGWGSMFVPRAGQEVVVQFLNGDPDKPIITGALYNGINKPPYEIPDHKTRGYIRTESFEVESGKKAGFNELLFEDKKDAEKLGLHASKDMETIVVNEQFNLIQNNRHDIVYNDSMHEIRNDCHLSIGGKQVVEIGYGSAELKNENEDDLAEVAEGGSQTLKIKGNRITEIEGKDSLSIKDDAGAFYEKNLYTEVTEEYEIKAEKFIFKAGGTTVTISSDGVKIETDKAFEVKADGDAKIGGANIEIKGQQNVTAEAANNFEIKGKAGVKLESSANAEIEGKAGVKLTSSANVDIKGNAQVNIEGTAGANLKGAMLTVEGQGMATLKAGGILTIQGALVNIN
ncbi:MAG: type VI secretion system tip protein VgrG [Puniceicoccales bacterium]|nr:type VI secretion system tip protein VgrG [Puniceicoccales bacterium]